MTAEQERFAEKMTYWSKMRDVVQHEDNLVHHRFTWLLQYEAIIIGGFFLAENAALTNGATRVIVATQLIFGCLMVLSLWFVWINGTAIASAYTHIRSVNDAWRRRYSEERHAPIKIERWLFRSNKDKVDETTEPPVGASEEFPPLRGMFTHSTVSYIQSSAIVLMLFNVIGLIVCGVVTYVVLANPEALKVTPKTAVQNVFVGTTVRNSGN